MKSCTCEDNFYKLVVKSPIEVESRSWHADGRGKLMECLRADSPHFNSNFGQSYVTTLKPGVIKAWHFHEYQIDRMVLLKGTVRFGCIKKIESTVSKNINVQSITNENVTIEAVEFGFETVLDLVVNDYDSKLIVIPPYIHHGFMNIGDEEAYVLNIPDNMYNYEEPDEQRTSCDYFTHIFDWRARMDG